MVQFDGSFDWSRMKHLIWAYTGYVGPWWEGGEVEDLKMMVEEVLVTAD